MLLISLTSTICTLCMGGGKSTQEPFGNCIWLDMERFIGQRILEIGFGHSINDNWVMCAGSALNIGAMKEPESSYGHLITNIIEMQYWPASAFTGPVLALGLESSTSHDIYPYADIGYCCRIWKGLTIGLGYRTGLSDSMTTGRQSEDGIRIKAYFGF